MYKYDKEWCERWDIEVKQRPSGKSTFAAELLRGYQFPRWAVFCGSHPLEEKSMGNSSPEPFLACQQCEQPATNQTPTDYLQKPPLCEVHEHERAAAAVARYAAYLAQLRQNSLHNDLDKVMLQVNREHEILK